MNAHDTNHRVIESEKETGKGFFQRLAKGAQDLRESVQARVPDRVVENGSRLSIFFQMAGSAFLMWSANDFKVWQRGIGNLIELVGAALGTIIKEKPQTDEEIQRLEAMSKPRYLFERTLQTLNPFKHIRQTVGLTTAISGALNLWAGYHKNSERMAEKVYGFAMLGGGLSLLYSLKDNAAWKRFGAILAANSPNAVWHGLEAWRDQKDWKTGAAMVSFQTSNVIAFLLGGAAKEKSAAPIDSFSPSAAAIPTDASLSAPAMPVTGGSIAKKFFPLGDYREQRIAQKAVAETQITQLG